MFSFDTNMEAAASLLQQSGTVLLVKLTFS